MHLSDQQKGLEFPLLEKPFPTNTLFIELVPPDRFSVGRGPLLDLLRSRKSRRKFSNKVLNLEELSFLLWATQGVHRVVRNGYCSIRTVPSAGSRHPFETYLIIHRVQEVEAGIYRYSALENRLGYVSSLPPSTKLAEACAGQLWITKAAVVFIWTVIPYRTEWRYTEITSPKIIALDGGHVCQNLYLACEAIQAGTCAVGAYDQTRIDTLIGVDGKEEFVIYIAPVGR